MNRSDGCWWWTTTPYIDAYSHAEWVSSSPGASNGRYLGISFEEFKQKMLSQTLSWGEQGIGNAVATGKDIPRTHTGRLIYAIGTWDGKSWVACGYPSKLPYWWEVIEVIEYDWDKEWDVT